MLEEHSIKHRKNHTGMADISLKNQKAASSLNARPEQSAMLEPNWIYAGPTHNSQQSNRALEKKFVTAELQVSSRGYANHKCLDVHS